MELQWIGVAFLLGLVARRLGQPPLLGFLAAGFGLELLGLRPDEALRDLADLGILLLLFTIGLKLDVRSLLRRYVLGVTLVHMGVTTALIMGLLLGAAALVAAGPLAALGWREALLVAFAGSFSSTVFAVKLLESRDDASSLYGRAALGILIVQDLVAVVFLAASKGDWPSPWALGVLALPLTRPLIGKLLGLVGHRELLLLAGLAATLGGASLFELVGLKADLGALVAGLLCAGHARSEELAKSLLGLKDVFLVGFFLTIGLTGLPTWESFAVAVALSLLLPFKSGFFLWLATRFRLRARTALLMAFALGNYSEFGLIVGAVAVSAGWLAPSWLVTLALATGLSFLASSLLNERAFDVYRARREWLARFERAEPVPEERAVHVGDAQVLVFGMGRVGTHAYDSVAKALGADVVGFDIDPRVVEAHRENDRHVIEASATDADFWERLDIDREAVRLVLLAMSSHHENRIAIRQLRDEGFEGTIGATARHDDEVSALEREGADVVFHVLEDAGPAFADRALEACQLPRAAPVDTNHP
ncbi:MAG TPA: cation:proton antiporter [Sandaracinaceae bacterium LLY-WYZ-13_1]|nr:cation:proton antiporter [Sandaracinaceae bacterium LLY-WYZ-13_1]